MDVKQENPAPKPQVKESKTKPNATIPSTEKVVESSSVQDDYQAAEKRVKKLEKKNQELKLKNKGLKNSDKSPKEKHLQNWQSSRSAVAVMQSTKDYHVHLTTLSDQKANIVIAAASIIISVSLSQFTRHDGFIGIALFVLVGFTAVALMFAILSVAPIVSKKAKKMDINNPGFNPFFFGHYTDVPMDEYSDHIIEILKDQDSLYKEMVKDLYQMGQVLKQKKFKYLTLSYRVFFAGILLSFVICVVGSLL